MTVTLERIQIDLAITLGTATLARYVRAYGHYNNTFNSHTKGRFGEIAVDQLFTSKGYQVISHYKNPASDRLCDVEVTREKFQRLEVKTWSEGGWEILGRCFSPKQLPKLLRTADAVVWCTVPLENLEGPDDLANFDTLDVTLVGYSLPEDVRSAPIRLTGEPNMRKVLNHQVDSGRLRAIQDILS